MRPVAERQDHRRRAVDGHRYRGVRCAQVEARIELFDIVQRGGRDTGVADFGIDCPVTPAVAEWRLHRQGSGRVRC